MFRGVTDIFQTLGLFLPPEAVIGLLVLLVVAMAPAWYSNVKVKKINARVRRMVRADAALRASLADEVMALAGDVSIRLTNVFEQAVKYDQKALRERALDALRALGEHEEARRLEGKLVPEAERKKARPGHPLELVVAVERLLDEGLPDAAAVHLDEALARFPRDADLLALRARVADARSTVPQRTATS